MTAFDRAWDLVKSGVRPTGSHDYMIPSMYFSDFIDHYPELFTETLEELQPHLPESGYYTKVDFDLDPYSTRPSGWYFDGYGDPQLRTLMAGGEIIDPPPIDEIAGVHFQTGLGQTGKANIWNRANYSNMLRDFQWRRKPPVMFGKQPPIGASWASIPKDTANEYARNVFPEDHWAHHIEGFDAGNLVDALKWRVPHWDINTQFDTTPSTERFYRRTEQPEWSDLVTKPWREGERFVKVPFGSDDAWEGYSQGEQIRFEGNVFENAQNFIDYLTSTSGEEEWSERKRKEKGSSGLRGVSEGHETRSGRRTARRTKRMQERNE